jgi:hypothetical protein
MTDAVGQAGWALRKKREENLMPMLAMLTNFLRTFPLLREALIAMLRCRPQQHNPNSIGIIEDNKYQ